MNEYTAVLSDYENPLFFLLNNKYYFLEQKLAYLTLVIAYYILTDTNVFRTFYG